MKVYYYTVGSCRGDGFIDKGNVDLDAVIEAIDSIDCSAGTPKESREKFQHAFEDIMCDDKFNKDSWIDHLLYNVSEKKHTPKNILKLLRAIKTRKNVIETWEEGTTGVSILKGKYSRKAFEKDVVLVDYDALNGGGRSDVSEKIIK